MKNLLILAAVIMLGAGYANAQVVLDIGQDIGSRPTDENTKAASALLGEETTEQEEEKVDENKDKKGFFSFFNFGFWSSDEAPAEEVADVKKETEETQESFVDRLSKKAEAGDLKTQKALGYMYLYGKKGVEVDYDKAFKYYQMAAAQNDPIALNNLGSLYFNGIGVPVNYQKAIELFEKAAAVGNSEAALNLGFIYLSGRNASSNAPHAVQLFKQAAEAGSPIAKYMLGYAYYRGFGIKKDENKAAVLIKEVADKDFDEAQYVMGYMYLHGIGIAKNYANARKYLMWSANQGNLSAIMLTADLLAQERSILTDQYTAYVMYSVASVMGDKTASSRRDELESKLKPEEIMQAQPQAENFKPTPSELTQYARKTFSNNIRRYVDDNMKKK